MLSSRTLPLRPWSVPGAARRATVSHAILATVIVGLHGAGVAWAQADPSTAQAHCDRLLTIRPIGDARDCNLEDGGARDELEKYIQATNS
jgi:hypothetical protein